MSIRRQIFLFFTGFAVVAAAPIPPLTLDSAIRTAWSNDPAVAAMALAPELTRARETQAAQPPVPEVEVRGSAPLAKDSEWSVGVGVTRRLPQAERVELARAYARLEGDSLPFELRERRRLVAGEVRRLWYELAVQQAREQAALRAAETQREIPRSAERRRAAGETPDLELDLLRLDLARAENARAIAEAEAEGGSQRLRIRLRLPAGSAPRIETGLPALLERPPPEISDAPAGQTSLELSNLEVRRAETALALARASSRPVWSIGAGLDFERRANDATGKLETEPRLSVQASKPWPGARPFNRGEVLEREAALRISAATREARREEFMAELSATLSALRSLRSALEGYRALIKDASELPLRLAAAFARGEISGLQLAQARQQQISVESDYFSAVSRYLAALAEAETATGIVPTLP